MPIVRIETPAPRIAHLVIDDPERKVNVLDAAAIGELEAAVEQLERTTDLDGVVVRSGKPGSFVAGADVHAIAAITDPDEVVRIVRRAQGVFTRLSTLRAPTVAAIDGVCLGGGTELALACASRIASEEPHTQIGLPEVLLGILPGFGGTTRLPRLVGLSAALDLILTGRSLDGKRAVRIGLVARAVPAAWLIDHAHRRIAELKARPEAERRDRFRPRTMMSRLLDGNVFGRALVLSRARGMTQARTGGNYPAPLAAISVIEHGIGHPLEVGFDLEARRVSDLVVGPVCKNLIRIFLVSEQAKKGPASSDPSLKPAPVRTLFLAGAGVMGGGIAEIASRSGVEVRVRDVQPAALTRGLQTVRGTIEERSRKRRIPPRERDAQMARITPTLELSGVGRADLALEAVVEDLDVKRRVFAELEVRMRPDAVLATNTSSLSVNALSEGLAKPERFCGLHFFNPVSRMPLVEVVRGSRTSERTIMTAVAFARRLGKTPVVVGDAPGFVVNRVLMPYLREAMHLLEEGFPMRLIDASMRRFGMPMGPFEVLDEVGLDVAQKVAAILARSFPERMTSSPALEKMVQAKRLGKKNGLGFYRHRGRRREIDPQVQELLGLSRERTPHNLDMLSERMALAMINESALCLEEHIVADADMLDIAMVFGAGFPPFRGGPLRYADSIGLPRVESRLTALRAEKGERFRPAALLAQKAVDGSSFTGWPRPGSSAPPSDTTTRTEKRDPSTVATAT
jgi:3-hydroxyacyl-CoA dehydrogenase/enoyl-CoA hydratase/3-hydroxybutyryl-CoA epimerase